MGSSGSKRAPSADQDDDDVVETALDEVDDAAAMAEDDLAMEKMPSLSMVKFSNDDKVNGKSALVSIQFKFTSSLLRYTLVLRAKIPRAAFVPQSPPTQSGRAAILPKDSA